MIVLAHDLPDHDVRSLGDGRWRCDTCGQEGDVHDPSRVTLSPDVDLHDQTVSVGVAVHVELGERARCGDAACPHCKENQ